MSKDPRTEAQAKVLVVANEPLVRILIVQVLEEAGFRVKGSEQLGEALSSLDGNQIAALVTDVNMPGSMDGRALAWRVHQLFPSSHYPRHFRSDHARRW